MILSCMGTLEEAVAARFTSLESTFDERSRRLWSAAEALAAGRSGVMAVHRATGIARSTIYQGIKELKNPNQLMEPNNRTRNPGGGRKKAIVVEPELQGALEALWNQSPEEIRNRLCVGPVRAYGSCQEN